MGRLGSGFLVDRRGRILTNAHVLGDEDRATVTFDDGTESPAEVLGRDESTDLVVLRAEDMPPDVRPLPLGRSAGLTVGDPVIAIGNPFGLERTATTGIVSALKRIINAPNDFEIQNVVQTDAAINQGNSGGPAPRRPGARHRHQLADRERERGQRRRRLRGPDRHDPPDRRRDHRHRGRRATPGSASPGRQVTPEIAEALGASGRPRGRRRERRRPRSGQGCGPAPRDHARRRRRPPRGRPDRRGGRARGARHGRREPGGLVAGRGRRARADRAPRRRPRQRPGDAGRPTRRRRRARPGRSPRYARGGVRRVPRPQESHEEAPSGTSRSSC